MKSITLLSALLLFVSCGEQTQVTSPTVNNCYSEVTEGGVNVTCGDTTSFLPNGENGQDGTFEGYLDIVEVCPQVKGAYKETLLHLNGEYMAFLASNDYRKERLVKLDEGKLFRTTDGRNVNFSIIEGEIICI